MNKLKLSPKGITPILLILGGLIGFGFWVLLVKWMWNSLVPTFGGPVFGFGPATALAVLILLLVAGIVGLKESGK